MATHDLGKKLAVHRWKSGSMLVFMWLVLGLPWTYLLVFKIPINDATDAVIAVGLSAFVVGLLAWVTRLHFKKKNDRVDVYEEGLVNIVAGKETALRWDEIEKVTSKVEQKGVSTLHVHVVVGKGNRWAFTQLFEDIESLAGAIRANVSRCIVDRTMVRIRAGEEVPFGSLRVGQAGITKGTDVLKWDEVAAIEHDHDEVRIRKKGALLAWAMVTVGSAHAYALHKLPALGPGVEDKYR
jgi:hypothetical protein